MFNDVKIAQFIPDDKFSDSAYRCFCKVAPGSSDFFIASRQKTLKYIKETPVSFVRPSSFRHDSFMKSLEKYDFIILHSLSGVHQKLLAHASDKLKFVWVGMGCDYYDLIYENKNLLYQKKTRELIDGLMRDKYKKSRLAKHILREIILKTPFIRAFFKNEDKRRLIEKINYFAPVLENEYKMVSSKFDFSFPRYIDWNYGMNAKFFDNKTEVTSIKGSNILLGNSATPSNNHIEVLDFLRLQNIGSKKIICPLSYGYVEYALAVKKKAANWFHDRFISIDDFLTFDEYISLISTCSNAIMNHHRQQGSGNVVAMLYMGANVFLNKINPLYSFCKNKSVVLFSIDELYENPDLLNTNLSSSDVEKNRTILKSWLGEQAIIKKTENLIKTAMLP